MSKAELSGEDARILGELFSEGPVVVFKWINAENWPVEFVTSNVTHIFGHSAQDFMSGSLAYAGLLHPDDLKRVAQELAKASASGVVNFSHDAYRIIHPDGECRWIEDHTRIVRNADGIITHYIGYVVDVTERRQIEESRRDSEARYRTMLKTTQQGYWLVDKDAITVEVNPALCKMLGYTAEELVGSPPSDFLTEDSKAILREQMQLRVAGDQRTYELVLKAKDGTLKRALMHGTTLPDTITSARSFALVTDITEIIETQQTLSTLWHALEQSPVGIIITDADGAIEYANPYFTTMSGYSADEILGQNPKILKSGHTEPPVYEDLWKTISAGEMWRGDLVNARKSGEIYWERQTIAPIIDSEGTIRNYVSFKEDISAFKETVERQARAKDEAELSNQAKSMFLENMSHELRTPLNAIIGFSEMIRDRAHGDIDAPYREYANLINDSGAHLLNIIMGILDMTKLETNHVDLVDENFSVHNTVFECITLLSDKAQKARVELINDTPITCRLRADRMRIKQIMLNLLTNAINFSQDGEIAITVGRRFGRFAITITDNGRGMTSEELTIALKPFGQNKRDIYHKDGEGLGLGLPIARRLIEAHAGKIEVESARDKGTTVSIVLPDERVIEEGA